MHRRLVYAHAALLSLVIAGCQAQAPEPGARPRPFALRCQTMPRLLEARAAHPPPLLADRKADGPPALRDAFGVPETPTTSAHFALRTGPMIAVDAAKAQLILDALEKAFQKEVVDMGLPAPVGSAQYLVNAYIGNSGGGAPDIDFEGAYTSVDREGFPYMTIHPSLLRDGEALQTTTAHELFHTIQDATGPRFEYDEGLRSGWYWEATAEWASAEVYPTYVEEFVGAFAMQPQVSVNYMDYPDMDTLIEYHHYGAAILPRYLTEKLADWTLVRDSWKQMPPPAPRTPVAALDALLATRGTSLRAHLADFALSNTIWDYAKGDAYARYADETVQSFGRESDLRVVDDLPAGGTTAERRVDAEKLPWGLAYNVIRVKRPTPGPWTVVFRGDAAGSSGDPAAFDVIVARTKGNGRTLVEAKRLALTDGAGTLDLPEVGATESLLLVVGSIPEDFVAEETFGYTYELKSTAPVAPDLAGVPDLGAGGGGGGAGGGCSVGGRAPSRSALALWVLALVALAVRRRRA
jgi:MYXO-CTERM domain-containing protein